MDLITKQLYYCLFFTKIKNFLNQFKNQSPTSKRHYYYKPYIHIVKCTYQAILEGQYGSRYVSQMGSLLELRVSSFPHKKGGVKKKKEVYIQQGMKYETYLGTFSLIFCSIFSSSLPFFQIGIEGAAVGGEIYSCPNYLHITYMIDGFYVKFLFGSNSWYFFSETVKN